MNHAGSNERGCRRWPIAALALLCSSAVAQVEPPVPIQVPGVPIARDAPGYLVVEGATARHRIVTPDAAALRSLLTYREGLCSPIVSAHRGGPAPGYPENCIATFERTIGQTFALLEVDPRLTRDGQVVLMHDTTLDRTTTGTGRVADHTLGELKQLRLKDPTGAVTPHTIPTLDEAFAWARGRAVLVLDQKDLDLETRVRTIMDHDATGHALPIVMNISDAQRLHALCPAMMMELMMPDRRRVEAFDTSGVPWSQVIAFVGHEPPTDAGLLRLIHDRGALCMAGTSRNLDRELAVGDEQEREAIAARYNDLLSVGVDLIEADLAAEVGRLLYAGKPAPAALEGWLRRESGP